MPDEVRSSSEIKYIAKSGDERVGSRWAAGPSVKGLTESTWLRDGEMFILVGKDRKKTFIEAISIEPGEEIGFTKDGDVYVKQ